MTAIRSAGRSTETAWLEEEKETAADNLKLAKRDLERALISTQHFVKTQLGFIFGGS